MPIYEYRCLDCWAHVNIFFLPPRRPEPRCDACQSTRIVRIVPGATAVKPAVGPGPAAEAIREGDRREDREMTARRGRSQAVILAGGLGTRLWPLTRTLPKSMVPVAGRPFMEYQLAYLRRWRVGEAVVCLGHLGHLIEQHFGDGRRFGVQIRYGYERERLLGTAGAVKNVESLLRDVFVVIYGDSYAVCDLPRALKYFLSQDRLGLMVVYRNDNLWDRSNVVLDGPYVGAYEKGGTLPGPAYIDFGVSIFRREAFAAVPAGIPTDLSVVYAALITQRQLLKYEARERFYEIGSPEGLREFEGLVRSGVIREFLGPPGSRARL